MPHPVSYVHALDGRLRVRLSRLKNNPRTAAALRQSLRTHEGVTDVDVRLLTGSVLVEFDSSVTNTEHILSVLDIDGSATSSASRSSTSSDHQRLLPSTGNKVGDIVLDKALEIAAERLILALL